jgi:hypothetical protein
MGDLEIEGIPQKDLDLCVEKIEAIQLWAASHNIDRWALRTSLLKALHEDSEDYFRKTKGTYRDIAAFDNGVATALDSLEDKQRVLKDHHSD